MKKIRILIADDHSVVRSGLRALFKTVPEFTVVGEATDGNEAVTLSTQLNPDVAVIDISMPKLNGIEATRIIKKNNPTIKVLILTIHENEEYAYQMIRAGANGYVLKNAEKKELLTAVRSVAAGDRFFSPGVSKLMIEEFVRRVQEEDNQKSFSRRILTNREIEILRYIAQGFTNHQIAEKLFLSVRTVDTHRTHLMRKLDIHDTAGLVRYAIETGLLNLKAK